MLFRNRIHFAPDMDGSSGGGTATADVPAEAPAQTPSAQGGSAPSQDSASRYKEILAKAQANPSYEMSDEETEIFEKESQADLFSNKQQKSEYEDPNLEDDDGYPTLEEDGETKKPDAPADKAQAVPETLKSLVGDDSPVGAKSLEELPEKVKGLVAKVQEMSGRDGAFDAVKRDLTSTRDLLQDQHKFFQDFLAGDARAIEHAKKHFGWDPSKAQHIPATRPQGKPEGQKPDSSKFLDDELARHVEERDRQWEERLNKMEKFYQDQQSARDLEVARDQVFSEVSDIAGRFPEYAVPGGNMRQLLNAYWRGDFQGKDVDARIKPVVELIELAANKNLPDLETAHALRKLKHSPQEIADAERRGREQLARHKPSVGLSDQQGSSGGQDAINTYSDSDIEDMVTGRKEIPDEWIHPETGNLIFSRMPKNVRDKLKQAETLMG